MLKKNVLKQLAPLCMLAFISFVFNPTNAQAQQAYKASSVKTTVDGTSTLHDWQLLSDQGQAQASFQLQKNELKGIQSLTFTLQTESLKSSRSGLAKNAYKALASSKHKNIVYTMKSGTVTKKGTGYTIVTDGSLQIAGKAFPLKLTSTATVDNSGKISVSCSTKFNMSSYGIKPPTVLLGSIKTADPIALTFTAQFTN